MATISLTVGLLSSTFEVPDDSVLEVLRYVWMNRHRGDEVPADSELLDWVVGVYLPNTLTRESEVYACRQVRQGSSDIRTQVKEAVDKAPKFGGKDVRAG